MYEEGGRDISQEPMPILGVEALGPFKDCSLAARGICDSLAILALNRIDH